jgi:hypothetical protein
MRPLRGEGGKGDRAAAGLTQLRQGQLAELSQGFKAAVTAACDPISQVKMQPLQMASRGLIM